MSIRVPKSPGTLVGLGLAPDPAEIGATFIGKRHERRPDAREAEVHVPGRPPRLDVDWLKRHHHLVDDVRALLDGPWPKLPRRLKFHDPWRPRRHFAVLFSFSSLVHVVLIALPLPFWLAAGASRDLRPQRGLELTWSGPTKDLPALGPKAIAPKRAETQRTPEPAPSPKPEMAEPAAARIERASRQTILATPAEPNHPRQMLLQPMAAPDPPKILPELPNIVEWGRSAQPKRPSTSISRDTLARLLPKARPRRSVVEEAAPALPNQELRVAPISIASNVPAVARPRMPVPAASVPLTVQRRDVGDAAGSMPELGELPPGIVGTDDSTRRIIALSANPAPAPPSLDVPLGNLAARVAVSPLGPTPGPDTGAVGGSGTGRASGDNGAGGGGGGSAGGNGTGGGGGGPAQIYISSGDPNKTSNIVGPGGGSGPGSGAGSAGSGLGPPRTNPSARNSPPRLSSRDLALGSGRGGLPMPAPSGNSLEGYTPARPEEAVFRQRRVYTVAVNMPNLTSVTGSWILKFAELDAEGKASERVPAGNLSSPEPIRKVDPKYPPALVEQRIEGDVVLYAIIRKDGTVDSVQVLRSLEPQLDKNAAEAFTRWQFWPAIKSGTPLDIEAVITIPFRAFVPR